MKDIVSKQIFDEYPDYIRGVVVARNISNYGERTVLSNLLKNAQESIRREISLQDLVNHPRIANWRKAYSNFGVKPKKFPSSIESLVRRVIKGKEICYINTLVAIFNYFSLTHRVPSGGDDLDIVCGDLSLRFANGNEIFIPFNSHEVEHPIPGEVIYANDEKILCRCWNWRQGAQTKLTPSTKNVKINVDCLPPVQYEEAEMITKELAELVGKFCGGHVRYYLLEKNQPEVVI